MRDLQLQRLKAIVQRAYDRVALFRQRMEERDLTPQDVRTLEDIVELPFTVKTDLRDTYPFGLFASPMKDIVRLHASSGTTGKPIVVAYTQEDIEVWTQRHDAQLRGLRIARGRRHPERLRLRPVHRRAGRALRRGGAGRDGHSHFRRQHQRQLMVMKDFGVTAICCTPSYFLHLIEQAPELGVNIKELPLARRRLWRRTVDRIHAPRIEADSGIKAYDIYGLSEIIGPGVAMECQCQAGPHIFEDCFYPEIIDLKTGKPCCRTARKANWC